MAITSAVPGLAQPDPRWPARAARDMERVRRALGATCRAVHHVGSTSVAGLPAVPVLDLVAELDDMSLQGVVRLRLLAHGFAGLPGPSHCAAFVVEDTLSGCRMVELVLYPSGDEAVRSAIAFFACLRIRPEIAAAYGAMKLQARAQHGADTSSYGAAKQAWVQQHAQRSHDLALRPVE